MLGNGSERLTMVHNIEFNKFSRVVDGCCLLPSWLFSKSIFDAMVDLVEFAFASAVVLGRLWVLLVLPVLVNGYKVGPQAVMSWSIGQPNIVASTMTGSFPIVIT